MNEEEFKPIVKQVFSDLGLHVHDLDERGNSPTPDFQVTGRNSKYTVELKIKGDDPEETSKEAEALSQGGVVGKSIPIGPRNTLAGIIREGVHQMVRHDPKGESFRVIWLHSAGQDPQLHYERFKATLFGTETLFSLGLQGIITCFYFNESGFYSWRESLDGAMLTYPDNGELSAQLCINTHSPRAQQFRESELVQSMSKGLCDPDTFHGLDNDVMIADCSIDRKNPKAVLAYLQEKYGFDHLQDIPMQQHTGKILIDPGERKQEL